MSNDTERDDLEELKAQWIADPIWEIGDTEGFEQHREELLAFSKQMKEKWAIQRQEHLRMTADHGGLPQNLVFAKEWEKLQRRLEAIEKRLDGSYET